MTDRGGVVLAGGHSHRFGERDKALAELDGDPMVRRVVDRISTVVDHVVVSCRPAQFDRIEEVFSSSPDVDIVEDRHPGAGPLAGVEAGLDVVSGDYAAVVACDMPFVDPIGVEELFRRAAGADGAVPTDSDGNLQPVQAVYRTEPMRRAAADMLPDGGSLHAALDSLSVVVVPVEILPDRSLHNVNTRQDLTVARRLYEQAHDDSGSGNDRERE